MKSLYDFIIQPMGDKYSNTVKIGNKDIVVNTKIENWKFVNRLAIVKETPLAFDTKIKKGDIVYISADANHALKNNGPDTLEFYWIFPTDRFSEVEYISA